jgi:hypothetical protein
MKKYEGLQDSVEYQEWRAEVKSGDNVYGRVAERTPST